MIDLVMIEECSPNVHPTTMQTLIQTESSGNPYAIGVVGLDLANQPETEGEAITAAQNLIEQGYNVSLGLAQINMHNFEGLGLTVETAFDPCENLKASSQVLENCFERAEGEFDSQQEALQAAFSCYYSNNFERGFESDDSNGNSYVERVANNSNEFKIPAIEFGNSEVTTNDNNEGQEEKGNEEVYAIENTAPPEEVENNWDVFSDFSN